MDDLLQRFEQQISQMVKHQHRLQTAHQQLKHYHSILMREKSLLLQSQQKISVLIKSIIDKLKLIKDCYER